MAGGQEEYPQLPTCQTDQSLLTKMNGDSPTQTIKKEAAPNPTETTQRYNERFAFLRQAYESAPQGSDEKAAALKRWQVESTRLRDTLEQQLQKFSPLLAPPELTRAEAETGPSQEQTEREKRLEFIISLLVRGHRGRCSDDAIIRDSGSVHLIAASFGMDDLLGQQKANAMYNGDIGTEPWDLWMEARYAEAQTKWAELKQARQATQQQPHRASSQPGQLFQERSPQQSHQPQQRQIDPTRLERLFIQTSQPSPKQPHQQAPSQRRQQPSERQQLQRGSLEHLQTVERGLQEAHQGAQDPQQQRGFTAEQLERFKLPKSKQSHVGEWVRQQQQAPAPPPSEQQSITDELADDERQLRMLQPPLVPTIARQAMQGVERRLLESQQRQAPAPDNQQQKRAASSPLLPPLEQTMTSSAQPRSFLVNRHQQVQPAQPVPSFQNPEQPRSFLLGDRHRQAQPVQPVPSFLNPELLDPERREEIRELRRQRRAANLLPPMLREQPPLTLREHQDQLQHQLQQQQQQQQQSSTTRRRTYADIYREAEAREKGEDE